MVYGMECISWYRMYLMLFDLVLMCYSCAGEKLGSGQYGEVYKGEWFRDKGKTVGIPIAVKTLKVSNL